MSTGFSHLTHQTLPTVGLAVCIQASPVIAVMKRAPTMQYKPRCPACGWSWCYHNSSLHKASSAGITNMYNPDLPYTNVQLTRHTDHNPWSWHIPNPATYPKQSYQLQLLKLHKSTATKAYLPLQHLQHLQCQPVPYPGRLLSASGTMLACPGRCTIHSYNSDNSSNQHTYLWFNDG